MRHVPVHVGLGEGQNPSLLGRLLVRGQHSVLPASIAHSPGLLITHALDATAAAHMANVPRPSSPCEPIRTLFIHSHADITGRGKSIHQLCQHLSPLQIACACMPSALNLAVSARVCIYAHTWHPLTENGTARDLFSQHLFVGRQQPQGPWQPRRCPVLPQLPLAPRPL